MAVLLAVTLLGVWARWVSAQSEPSQIRSLTDVRPRIPDEHDRPYFQETQSHRGFEIRDPQFTVFAETSKEDARAAAGHVRAAWQSASKLADRWTTAHQHPDFGLNALQVVITNQPPLERDAPLTTVNVVGVQTQLQINIAPGQPSLAQQVVRLREGAAFAMLHAVGLDSVSPPWVMAGISAVAGRAGLSDEVIAAAAAGDLSGRFGGQQWRFARAAQDRLDDSRLDHQEANERMTFLLMGDDAVSAPEVFAALRQANRQAAVEAAGGIAFRSLPADVSPAPTNTWFDRLLESHQTDFAAWKANPRRGQPLFEPPAGLSQEALSAQREMLVLMKLERRFAVAASGQEKVAGGPKIVEFNREQGAVISRPTTRPAFGSFAALASRLLDSSQPAWATIDNDGSLLLSTDRTRIEQLLAPRGGSYSLERQDGKTQIVLKTEGGQAMRGWLEENPDDKTRPIARFETVAAPKRTKTLSGPQPVSAKSLLLR
jgi:hypothetical protein